MTTANWIAVVVPVIGILGGAALYIVQKRLDRLESRRVLDIEASVELLNSIGDLAAAHLGYSEMGTAQANYALAKMKFVAVANDKAVEKLAELDVIISASNDRSSAEEIDVAIANLVRAIRVQNFGSTKLSNIELLAATPFSKSRKDG